LELHAPISVTANHRKPPRRGPATSSSPCLHAESPARRGLAQRVRRADADALPVNLIDSWPPVDRRHARHRAVQVRGDHAWVRRAVWAGTDRFGRWVGPTPWAASTLLVCLPPKWWPWARIGPVARVSFSFFIKCFNNLRNSYKFPNSIKNCINIQKMQNQFFNPCD
jgi:hypothetical protein